MTQTNYSAVVFSFPVGWDFFDRKWKLPMYQGYRSLDILENELYDFTY